MDKLPDLILIKILNNLTIYNQINLRLLNKRFKSIVDDNLSNSKKELIFFFKLLPNQAKWKYNQEQINFKNLIIFNEKIKNWNYFKKLFYKNIERLYLFFFDEYYQSSNIDWIFTLNEFINLCTNLVHLELTNHCLKEIDINLPNLKTLFVCSGKVDIVNLNCPNLEKLSIQHDFVMSDKFNQIRNSLKFLKVESFSYLPGYNLPNLEVIYFSKKLTIDISHFEKLKEIHFFFGNYIFIFEELVNHLKSFLNQKKTYNRECLEIFYAGIKFQIDTIDLIKPIYLEYTRQIDICEKTIKLYLNNQLKLDNLMKRINFSNELFEEIDKMNYNQINNLSKYLKSAEFRRSYNFKSEYKFINYEFKLINLLKNVRSLSLNLSIFNLNEYELNKFVGLFVNLFYIGFAPTTSYQLQFSHFYFRFLTNFKKLKEVGLYDQMISIEELDIIIEEFKLLYTIKIYRNLRYSRMEYRNLPMHDLLHIKIIRDYENIYQIEFSSQQDTKLKIFKSKGEFFIHLKEKEKLKGKFYNNFLENNYNINFYRTNTELSKKQYFYLQEH